MFHIKHGCILFTIYGPQCVWCIQLYMCSCSECVVLIASPSIVNHVRFGWSKMFHFQFTSIQYFNWFFCLLCFIAFVFSLPVDAIRIHCINMIMGFFSLAYDSFHYDAVCSVQCAVGSLFFGADFHFNSIEKRISIVIICSSRFYFIVYRTTL